MKVFYNKVTNKVQGNTCFGCIPSKCLDNKETEIVRYAEKKINNTVDERLSGSMVRFFNYFLLNQIAIKTRNNIPKGIEKAREIIPGTITKLLNYFACIFFLFSIPLIGIGLLLYFDILGIKLSQTDKIISLSIICVFDIILIGVTISKYVKNRMDNYIEQITKEVMPI